jgi:hypothetical protein
MKHHQSISPKYLHNAPTLMTLSPRNKHHAMIALANLAKFTGRYDEWQKLLIQEFHLHASAIKN